MNTIHWRHPGLLSLSDILLWGGVASVVLALALKGWR